jgi:hypothetical protein
MVGKLSIVNAINSLVRDFNVKMCNDGPPPISFTNSVIYPPSLSSNAPGLSHIDHLLSFCGIG